MSPPFGMAPGMGMPSPPMALAPPPPMALTPPPPNPSYGLPMQMQSSSSLPELSMSSGNTTRPVAVNFSDMSLEHEPPLQSKRWVMALSAVAILAVFVTRLLALIGRGRKRVESGHGRRATPGGERAPGVCRGSERKAHSVRLERGAGRGRQGRGASRRSGGQTAR